LKIASYDLYLYVFGNQNHIESVGDFRTIGTGVIHDDKQMAIIYSSADVFIAPSRQENLSNAVMESLSCGTPVVAFNIGGMKDLIEHKKNGYLARPFDTQDLRHGIEYCLNHKEMKNSARASVVSKYNMEKIGEQYGNLYDKLLRGELHI